VGWAYNAGARAPGHDPAGAARLLRESVPAAFRGTLACPPSFRPLAEAIVGQLGAAGLSLRLEIVPMREYLARLLEGRDFDLALMSGSQAPDPDNLATRFGSRGSLQFMGYRSAAVDRELERAARETRVLSRAGAYFRVQEILAADLPVVPLVEGVRVSVFRDGVRGLPQDDARALVADYAFPLIRLRIGDR
jgi:ABC-type transport system substrate-binding protein